VPRSYGKCTLLGNASSSCGTSERYHRHGFRVDCALCTHHPELLDHLLLGCSFARKVWLATLNRCSWRDQVLASTDSLTSWWLRARKHIAKAPRKGFDSLVICVAWCVWLEPNDRVFRGVANSATGVTCVVWETMQLWCQAGLVVRSMLLGE
jgi:hypothetical protein